MSVTSRRLVWALTGLALALIGLHLAALPLGEPNAWGVWPAAYLPPAWRWALAAAAALLALFGDRLAGAVFASLARLAQSLRRSSFVLRPCSVAVRLTLALLAAVPFVLLRIRHLGWGDAKLLIKGLADPYWLTYVWQAPLDVFMHAKVWQAGHALLGWTDPAPAYRILSTLAGVAFVWILLGLACWLGRDRTERVLLASLVATLGTMQLFFGYIENYSIMTVGVLAYGWLALRSVRGETPLVWPAVVLALTHAFHPSTIILAPSLVVAAWMTVRRAGGGRQALWRAGLSIAAPYLVVFAGVVALMTLGSHGLDALLGADFPGGGDRRWFVPLLNTATKFERYTLFSAAHLLDIANQQLLSAPVVWPALALSWLLAWRLIPRREPEHRLLAVMAGSYLLLTLVWNPDYGGRRDWDLFAPAAVPAALLLGYTLPRALPERAALRRAGWALVAAQGFHTATWICSNAL